MIGDIADKVNADDGLVRRGRFLTLDFLVGVDDTDYIIRVDKGRIASITERTKAMVTGQFGIRAKSDVWTEFWRPVPRRDYHDLFSMFAAGVAQIDGDITPFMQNIRYFKDVLAKPRAAGVA